MMLGICGLAGGDLDHRMEMHEGEIHLLKSEYAQARIIYSHIIETIPSEQNPLSHAISLLNIAQIDTICGDTGDVYHKLNQAKHILNSFNSRQSFFCNLVEADMKLREEKFELAKVRFEECLRSTGGADNQVESFCLERLADIRAWPTSEWQFRWTVMYCGYAYKSGDKLSLHKALLFLGDLFITKEEDETASNLYQVALEGFTSMDVHRSRAQCMMRLGDLANKQGHTSAAINLWKTARPLFERSLQAKDIAEIDAILSTVETAHQKALVELATLHVPDELLNKETSGVEEVEAHLSSNNGPAPITI
jgi:tetratricopeptide (TPR) repeat protein